MGEINSGADFGKLAITYSADSQALKGGNMGWGKLQEIPTLFAERLVSAKKATSSAQSAPASASTS